MPLKDNSQKPLKLYWQNREAENGGRNFGDWLSPVLCSLLSGRQVEYARPKKADLVAIGSVLHRMPDRFWSHRMDVWGSGFMHESATQSPIHRYHAVRGYLTAERLSRRVEIKAFGDPGLLVNLILPGYESIEKTVKIGFIPHSTDQQDPQLHALIKALPGSKIIDILSGTEDFLRQVASCEFVFSSSLHGLVTADAFAIPNAWIKISDNVKGEGFKFFDYYSVFGIKPEPLQLNDITPNVIGKLSGEWKRQGIEKIRQDLKNAFPYQK